LEDGQDFAIDGVERCHWDEWLEMALGLVNYTNNIAYGAKI